MSIKPGWKGRFYEDFEVGDVYQHPLGRAISESDNAWFTLLSMNPNQLHFNKEYGARTEFDRRLIYLFGSLSLITAIFILDGLRSSAQSIWLLAYAIFLGFGEGSRSSLVTAFTSDLFPGNSLGAINGAIGASFAVGAAILPWLAGLLYDLQGNYTTGFILSASIVIISTFSLWIAPLFLHQKH